MALERSHSNERLDARSARAGKSPRGLIRSGRGGGSRTPASTPQPRAGFTLIEMLVVISIATILAATLMPAYAQSRRAADRIRCANNIRQVGIAIVGYLEQSNDRLPELTTINSPTQPRYSEGMILTNADGSQVDGLGRLLRCAPMGGFLHDPRLLFCPCHMGDHQYERYEPQINRPWLDSELGTPAYGNYHYRGHIDPLTRLPLRRIMDSKLVLATDGLRTRSDFSHVRGTNRLFADGSVDWRVDSGGRLLKELPTGVAIVEPVDTFKLIWRTMDGDGMIR
jgi:prepilin-type N-terminal cleavage/methylation domain-containing protein